LVLHLQQICAEIAVRQPRFEYASVKNKKHIGQFVLNGTSIDILLRRFFGRCDRVWKFQF
jgi:hypothetical protein